MAASTWKHLKAEGPAVSISSPDPSFVTPVFGNPRIRSRIRKELRPVELAALATHDRPRQRLLQPWLCRSPTGQKQGAARLFLEWLALHETRKGGTPLGQIAAEVGVLPIHRADTTSTHFASTRQYYTGYMESLDHAVHPSTFLQYGLTDRTLIT